jgi:serine O-acetyltransferase
VVVSAGAKVLGGFVVGDGAKIGSNAVVIKPVPAGATAVGIPARIIPVQRRLQRRRDGTHEKKFRPTASRWKTIPLSQAMKGLIDSASGQEHQIALLWQAIEKLSAARDSREAGDCVPDDAARRECFEADKLNQLVGK